MPVTNYTRPHLVVVVRVVGVGRTVGLAPRVPVFAPVRTRTFAMQPHGTTASAVVHPWRVDAAPVVRHVVGEVFSNYRRCDLRGDRQRFELGQPGVAAAHRHLVVRDVVGKRLVVHEVQRRGGHSGRRGRVVDQRRFESGGWWPGPQHEAHHRYGEVKREQYELPVESAENGYGMTLTELGVITE